MKKAYWIVHVDITQPEAFAAYVAANGEALAQHGARFLARAGEHCVVEGQARSRNTIVEFPSYEAALACWHDASYQAAKQLRAGAALIDVVIVQGYDGPQPG